MTRIAPVFPPYDADMQNRFATVMPEGVEPLMLFRALAVSDRAWCKMMGGSLLDRGPLQLRHRELLIMRTSALADCEYEWGVHVAWFAARVGLTDAQIAATRSLGWDAGCWNPPEQALLRAADSLYRNDGLGADDFAALQAHFSEEQILEVIQLCGFYRTIAYIVRSLDLPLESWGSRFPDRKAAASRKGSSPGEIVNG